MKKVLFSVLMLLSCQGVFAVTDTHEVANSSATIIMFNVSSFSYTSLDSTSAFLLAGRFRVDLYNASTDTINCGFGIQVSTISTNAYYGKTITTLATWIVNIGDQIRLHCKATGDNISSRLQMIQYK